MKGRREDIKETHNSMPGYQMGSPGEVTGTLKVPEQHQKNTEGNKTSKGGLQQTPIRKKGQGLWPKYYQRPEEGGTERKQEVSTSKRLPTREPTN